MRSLSVELCLLISVGIVGNAWVCLGDSNVWNHHVGKLALGRFQPGIATLPNGSVLVAGGSDKSSSNPAGTMNTTEYWVPETNMWHPGQEMFYGRKSFGLLVLSDNRLMAVGGNVYDKNNYPYTTSKLARTVEIFDPKTGEWKLGANMTVDREGPAVVLLPDGSVLAIGGTNSGDQFTDGLKSCERWDPKTEMWSPIAPMPRGRWLAQAVAFSNGSVLVAGSHTQTGIYHPKEDRWEYGSSMIDSRIGFALGLLKNGSVIAAGGFNTAVNLDTAEMYMPKTNEWIRIQNLNYKRAGCRGALLLNHTLLVVGGDGSEAPRQPSLWDPTNYRCVADPASSHTLCEVSKDGSGADYHTCLSVCDAPSFVTNSTRHRERM
eukprot:m.70465 g.70465  ORF g.70465 m.70465 type:complete len:376 (-) comp24231_c1_seq1:183-1310(-)